MTDKRLVKRLLSGDEGAFRTFFDEYMQRVFRFALTRVNGDREAAKDIAQQSMTKAIRNLGKYRGEAQLFTWLCSICRNESIDWIRRHGKHTEFVTLIEDDPEIRGAIESMHADGKNNPDSVHMREQRYRLIQVALDGLPAHYGNALEWKYIEGYSVLEIAEQLGLSREATHSLLARARRAFAELYRPLRDGSCSFNNAGPVS